MGTQIGEYAKEYLQNKNGAVKGKVIIINHPQLATINDRTTGFVNVLRAYPEVKLIIKDVISCTAEAAQKLTDDLLITNPKGTVDVFFGPNAGIAQGELASIASAARNDIAILGIDSEKGQLDGIAEGSYYYATVAQDEVSIGNAAMKAAIAALDGKKTGDIAVPGILVTVDNIEEYRVQVDKVHSELVSYK